MKEEGWLDRELREEKKKEIKVFFGCTYLCTPQKKKKKESLRKKLLHSVESDLLEYNYEFFSIILVLVITSFDVYLPN